MAAVDFESITVGERLIGAELAPVSRLDLALYCGASGDHNPIHVDIDFARARGWPDVFVHGMLVAAHLARALTEWAPQSALREFDVRFVQVTEVGDCLRCMATVAARFEVNGERRIRLELAVRNQADLIRAKGVAVLAIV